MEESGEELEKSLERRGVGKMSWRKVREIVNVEENIVKQSGKQVRNTQQTSWKTSWKFLKKKKEKLMYFEKTIGKS